MYNKAHRIEYCEVMCQTAVLNHCINAIFKAVCTTQYTSIPFQTLPKSEWVQKKANQGHNFFPSRPRLYEGHKIM